MYTKILNLIKVFMKGKLENIERNTKNEKDTIKQKMRKMYLHHEKKRVENNKHHDEILERGGGNHPPYFVLNRVTIFRHI